MSERTPNSSDGLNGSEPSMEDILASIRKIISDDEPVALESPEDIPAVDLVEASVADDLDSLMHNIDTDTNDLTSDAVLDAAVSETDVLSDIVLGEGESVDLNIDDVLAGLDEDILETSPEVVSEVVPEIVPEALSVDVADQPEMDDPLSELLGELSDEAEVETLESSSDVIEAESSIFDDDDDILSLLKDDLSVADEALLDEAPLVEEALVETVDVETAALETAEAEIAPLSSELDDLLADVADTPAETAAAGDDLEMDALLDDILLSPEEGDTLEDTLIEDIQLDSQDLDAEATLDVEAALEDDLTADISGEEDLSDLELVKSLMADLADDTGELESEDDLDALLAIPEVKPEAEATVLSDILNKTIEDELQNFADEVPAVDEMTSLDDVLGAEQDNVIENALPLEDVSLEGLLGADEADIELPSLSDIAAAAEADAVAVETIMAPQAVAATAGLAAAIGGAALGGAALAKSEPTAEIETEFPQVETEAAQIDEIVEIFETAEVSETHIEQTPEPISTQETSMPVKAVKTDAILDDVTEAATAGAFAELNQVVEDKAVFNERGPRIGDLVQDALRPMLKDWLDANLKGIVERAVAKEVKRISSGK